MAMPQSASGIQYHNKYGFMPRMDERSSLGRVFGNGVGNHGQTLIRRTPKEMATGIWSFDPRLMRFQDALASELDKELGVGLDDDDFCTNGVHAGWARLRCVAGYMSDPMSYTPADNGFYRESLGLSLGYTPDQRAIATEFWDIIFSRYKPAAIKVPKKSGGGARRYTPDTDWKRDFALFLYESPRFEAMLKCIEDDDWMTLANELEMVFMMYIQKREQIDTPGKPREVFDLQYALTNGREGRKFNANKHVEIDGVSWSEFSATRCRVIHAGPWVINCVLQIISTGHMQMMFEEFPSVFHVSTPDQITSIIDGNHISCGDVKEYDRSMSKDAIDVPHESAAKFWDPRLIKMSRLLYYSAYYAKPLSSKGTQGVFFKDFRRLDVDQVVGGNRSGHAWTSMIAKGNKCVDTLFVFHAMGLAVKGNVLTYLKSQGVINFINNGDDEVVYTPDAGLMFKYKQHRYGKKQDGHYHVDSEVGQGFSGLLLMYKDKENLIYNAVPKVHTSFEKIWINERGIGGVFRAFWPVGIIDRINNQELNPAGRAAWEVHNSLYRKMMAPHFGDFMSIVNTAFEKTKLDARTMQALTAADKDVLESPERIYYKYLESDITPAVYNQVTSKIEHRYFDHIIKSYYGGTINVH